MDQEEKAPVDAAQPEVTPTQTTITPPEPIAPPTSNTGTRSNEPTPPPLGVPGTTGAPKQPGNGLPGRHWHKLWFKLSFGLAVIAVLAGIGSFIGYKVTHKNTQPITPTTQVTTKPKVEQAPLKEVAANKASVAARTSDEVCEASVTTAKVSKWYGSATKLDDLKLFTQPATTDDGFGGTDYYKVGQTTNGNDIVLVVDQKHTISETTYLAFKDTAGYHLLTNVSGLNSADQTKVYGCNTDVTADATTKIAAFDTSNLSYNGVSLKLASSWYYAYFSEQNPKLTKLADTPNGTLYEETYKDDTDYKITRFVLQLPDTRYVTFKATSPLVDGPSEGKAPIVWTDNKTNTEVFGTQFTGCGSYGTVQVAKNLTDADITKVGSLDGRSIYAFASTDNSLFKAYYKDYQDNASSYADGYKDVSVADFQKRHAVIIDKDELGRTIVYVQQNFFAYGGCGKPVIYLYPTKPTAVQVKVDADIRVSIPAYNQGWDVLAFPSGKLFGKGGSYDSLYWEGYGHTYPEVTSGFVVAQADLESTMQAHLKQLGLNPKETSDFMTYWLPKMPTTPYVRLSWFGTRQVNELAPLHITPAPDTLIRIFLDYEGLQQPVSLPAQHLNAVPRRGFTVVEWGGLLKEPLPEK